MKMNMMRTHYRTLLATVLLTIAAAGSAAKAAPVLYYDVRQTVPGSTTFDVYLVTQDSSVNTQVNSDGGFSNVTVELDALGANISALSTAGNGFDHFTVSDLSGNVLDSDPPSGFSAQSGVKLAVYNDFFTDPGPNFTFTGGVYELKIATFTTDAPNAQLTATDVADGTSTTNSPGGQSAQAEFNGGANFGPDSEPSGTPLPSVVWAGLTLLGGFAAVRAKIQWFSPAI